jgi:DNA-binding winged helix-turn-helix (wHTH) protein
MNSQNTLCYVNDWLVDVQSGSIIHRETGEQKRLGEYQLKLLEVLALHAGEVLSREQLTNLVWEGRVIGNNSLPNAVHALRLALEDDGKNQRVIKTIPKRGYLLEKEFCSYVGGQSEEDDTNNVLAEAANIVGDENSVQTGDLVTLPSDIVPSQLPRKTGGVNRLLTYLLSIVCFISIGVSIYLYLNDDDPATNSFIVKKLQTPNLKQIDIHRVLRASQLDEDNSDPDKITTRLNPALSELDNHLRQSHSQMHVYYRSSDSILNYAFAIETPCGKKELSMNIYHWRINNERLNNIILKETERKLNEAASCNS